MSSANIDESQTFLILCLVSCTSGVMCVCCVPFRWAMRTGGIGGIKAATVDLQLLIYQNVTQEESVLSAIRRYGQPSI